MTLKIPPNEELEIFKTKISLVEYASSLGYERVDKKSKGKSVFMQSGSDRVVITTAQSGHGIYSTIDDPSDSGSIIDFVQKKQGLTLGRVRQTLRPWCGLTSVTPAITAVKAKAKAKGLNKPPAVSSREEKELQLTAGLGELKPYARPYLIKERGVSPETIKTFADQLKEDAYGNACFIHRNEKNEITGWEKKNTTFTGFFGVNKALFMHKVDESEPTKGLIIFEAALDALSFYELGEANKTDILVSIGGAPNDAQLAILLEIASKTRYAAIAVDNDESGHRLAKRLEALFTEKNIECDRLLSDKKDWNDDLKSKKGIEKMGFKIGTPRTQKQKKTTAQTVVPSTKKSPESLKSATPIVPPKALLNKAQAALESNTMQEEKGNRKEEDADDLYALDEVIDIDDYMNSTPAELDFLWDGGMLVGTVGALIAPGGAGKSFFGLAAGLAISAHGAKGESDILKLNPTKQGVVNYYVLEDPKSVLRQRLHAIRSYISDEASEEVKKNLKIRPMVGKLGFDFVNPYTKLKIIEHCTGSRLIIIDTLSRAHTYDENKNGEMSQLLKELEYIAEQTGAAVLFLHHTSKSSAKDGEVDAQQAARGASALIDNARWAGFVQTMTKEESERVFPEDKYDENPIGEKLRGFYVRYGVSKQNYSKRTSDVWFERQKGGVLIPVNLEEISKKQRKNLGRSRRAKS